MTLEDAVKQHTQRYLDDEAKRVTHARSCSALTPGEECTCGLLWRNMYNDAKTLLEAWQKRACEAETEIERLTAERDLFKKEFLAFVRDYQNIKLAIGSCDSRAFNITNDVPIPYHLQRQVYFPGDK